ncbi:MAG: Ig-like domain-containing protein [Oscillospiraceae bacterium]|nr:Ig-like domain-containing protein [Oscillospiraceae bacterium]
MLERSKAGFSVLAAASVLYSALFGGFSVPAAPSAPASAFAVTAEETEPVAETTGITAETTTETTTATTVTTAVSADDTETEQESTTETTSETTTETTTETTSETTTETTSETTTETTTVTTAVPLLDPVLDAEFDEGYPTSDTVLHLKMHDAPGISAIGISVTLPEILTADAGEGDVCTFTLSEAFDADNLFTYYNAETHVLSIVCAGMDTAAEGEELGSITLHIAEAADFGKQYPVKLMLSSLALADGREYALIERTVSFVPAESPLRTLSETELTVSAVGEPIPLSLSPEPPAGSCTWVSSDPETVSVDENGQAVCLQEGYAEITVTCEKRSYTCKLTVRFDRSLNADTMYANDDGDTLQLALKPVPDAALTWASSDPSVLSIDENGLAAAHRGGEVTVQVSSDVFEYAFPFRVVILREISELSHTFSERGQTAQLSLIPAPLDPVTWTSDDPEIAEVAEDGTVTPKKNGSTLIRAFCEEREYTCMVTVYFPYSLNFTDYAVRKAGEGVSLALLPKEEGMPEAMWQSSDSTIAEVDQDGNVTVLRKGEAIIYCVAGGKTYTCHVSLLPYLRGDVDMNGEVDIADAQLALQYYTDLLALKPGNLAALPRLAADVNEDSVIGVEDASAILQYVTDVLAQKTPSWEEILSRSAGSDES